MAVGLTCPMCGAFFLRRPAHIRRYKSPFFCSIKCKGRYQWTGERNPRYSGGKSYTRNGYVLVATHVGRILEHRYIMARVLGRSLNANEVVHHKDGHKSNNHIGNLELIPTKSAHAKLHGLGRHIRSHREVSR